MSAETIPAELRDRPQWVVWRREDHAGKLTKVPYVARPPSDRGTASGTRKRWPASSTDPSTWRTYVEAVEIAKDELWDGIGYVFSADDPYVGVDLDAELEEKDQLLIMAALDSYAERSPSGTGHHIIVKAHLFTQKPDQPSGRGMTLHAPPVKMLAESHHIPVFQPRKLRTPEVLTRLQEWQPDLIIVVAYGKMLPNAILEFPPHGCMNVHASLLPKYRGAAPIQWAIARGDVKLG